MLCVTWSRDEWRGSRSHPGRTDPEGAHHYSLPRDNFQLKPGQLVTPGAPKGGPLFSILKAGMEEAPAAPGFPERTYTQWIFTNYSLYPTQEHVKAAKPPGLWNTKSLPPGEPEGHSGTQQRHDSSQPSRALSIFWGVLPGLLGHHAWSRPERARSYRGGACPGRTPKKLSHHQNSRILRAELLRKIQGKQVPSLPPNTTERLGPWTPAFHAWSLEGVRECAPWGAWSFGVCKGTLPSPLCPHAQD